MAIHRMGARGVRQAGHLKAQEKNAEIVAPCIESAMVYLHHALVQTDDGKTTPRTRSIDATALRSALALSDALSPVRPNATEGSGAATSRPGNPRKPRKTRG